MRGRITSLVAACALATAAVGMAVGPGIVQAATSAVGDFPANPVGQITSIDFTKQGEAVVKDAIDIYGFSWGVKAPLSSTGGGGTGRAVFAPFDVQKDLDAVSVKLFRALTTHENIKKLVVKIYRKYSTTYSMQYTLTNALVSRIGHAAQGVAEEFPLESDQFSTSRICVKYLLDAGKPEHCFDLGKAV
jgi:type VI secretion system Hcp family effector